MHGASQPSSSSSAAPTSPLFSLDNPFVATATALLVAATTVGTWRVFRPSLLTPSPVQAASSSNAHDVDQNALNDKKKRPKERRKRATAPKLSKQQLQAASTSSGSVGKKGAPIRQPSALASKRTTDRTPSVSVTEHDADEDDEDDTPRPTSEEGHDLVRPSSAAARAHDEHKISLAPEPENIPLPASPVIARRKLDSANTPSSSHSSSPYRLLAPTPPLPSPSASTTASTSGTPLTPPSLANSQLLPVPPAWLAPEWEWSSQSSAVVSSAHPSKHGKHVPRQPDRDASPSPHGPPQPNKSRGRSLRSKASQTLHTPSSAIPAQETAFPTLNTLPPPSTPLDVQVELMRQAVEAYRSREEDWRTREERLQHDLDQARVESEQLRRELSGMQWQLNNMGQFTSSLQSQIHTLKMQQIHHGPTSPTVPTSMPIPLYQPQPIPYPHPPPGHFYPHPYPYSTGSPMLAPPTPAILMSPPGVQHLHPLMAIPPPPVPRNNGTPSTPLDHMNRFGTLTSSSGVDNDDINADLVEAIMKRPESLRTSSTGSSSHPYGAGSASSYARSDSVSSSGGSGSRSASRSGSRADTLEKDEEEMVSGGIAANESISDDTLTPEATTQSNLGTGPDEGEYSDDTPGVEKGLSLGSVHDSVRTPHPPSETRDGVAIYY